MKIAFRADASLRIGTGHVMRCLTLATALAERGVDCVFLCRALEGHLCDRIEAAGFAYHRLPAPDPALADGDDHAAWAGVSWERDAEESAAILAGEGPDWLVVDHYAFDARWERAVLPASARLMVIDDLADRPHVADLLLDQNMGRVADDYDALVPEGCTRMIGPGHALLRPEFAASRAAALHAREGRGVARVLVSMGGVDLDDHSSRILRALAAAEVPEGLCVTVVIGADAPARGALERLAREMPFDCEVLTQVANLHELIAEADIAIGAAGVSAWERCCLGRPSIVVPIAANQRPGAMALAAAGAALLVEPNSATFDAALGAAFGALCDDACRADVADRAAQVCDGKGVARVSANILSSTLELRLATIDDARQIYSWRYEGGTARFYRNTEVPRLSEHITWFQEALSRPDLILWLVESCDLQVGHLKFEILEKNRSEVELSIYLNPMLRGFGLGTSVIEKAISAAKNLGFKRIVVEVHTINEASLGAFQRAGFHLDCSNGYFNRLSCMLNGEFV